MNKNIKYNSKKLSEYYANNRIKWDDFYRSERAIIQELNLAGEESILDIGCGCGGLGLALRERFGNLQYTGIEIENLAASKARDLNPLATIYAGDFFEVSSTLIYKRTYEVVFSLSSIDWNIEFKKMLLLAWGHVAPGGSLVMTFRITTSQGINDIKTSWQYINFEGELTGEKAPYIVCNAKDLFSTLNSFSPASISANGYFGTPSMSAVTPFESICFTAVSIKKRLPDNRDNTELKLSLPKDILPYLGIKNGN